MKCISRDAFIAWLKRIPIKDLSDGAGLCRVIMVEDFERAIRELPSEIIYDTEAEEYGPWMPFHNKTTNYGHWIPFYSEAAGDIQYCSVCGIGFGARTRYCPNCGKRMYDAVMRVSFPDRRNALQGAFEQCRRLILNFALRAKKRDSHCK